MRIMGELRALAWFDHAQRRALALPQRRRFRSHWQARLLQEVPNLLADGDASREAAQVLA
jgi:hypothetical protein